jgi:hypothetical protein
MWPHGCELAKLATPPDLNGNLVLILFTEVVYPSEFDSSCGPISGNMTPLCALARKPSTASTYSVGMYRN